MSAQSAPGQISAQAMLLLSVASEWTSVVVNAAAALASLAAVVVAIWRDEIRGRFNPHAIDLVVEKPGTITDVGAGQRALLRHLRVRKVKGRGPLLNCRVLVESITEQNEIGLWQQVPLAVPLQLTWAPMQSTPALASITSEQVVDFGYLINQLNLHNSPRWFQPAFYGIPADFRGRVAAGKAMRYQLRVEADNLGHAEYYVIEVNWDGHWEEDANAMLNHLVVRRLARVKGRDDW